MSGNLTLQFILDAVDRATAPLLKVQKAIDRIQQPVKRVQERMGRLAAASHFGRVQARFQDVTERANNLANVAGRAAGMVAGIGFAAGGAFFGFKRIADSIDTTLDQATKLNMPVEMLQRMQHAATMSGSSAEEMSSALEVLARRMAEARSGSQESSTWFTRVGISMSQLRDMTPVQVWEAIGDKFKQVGDEGGNAEAKLAALTALTGRSSTGLVQLANLGSEGMRRLYEEADRLGKVVKAVDAEAFAGFNDRFDIMKGGLLGVATAISSRLLPILNPLVERITQWAVKNRELVATRVAEFIDRIVPKLPEFFESVGKLAGAVGRAAVLADKFAKAVGGWEVILGAVAVLLAGSALHAVWTLGAAMFSLNAAFLLTPFGWFMGGVALVAGAASLIYNKWEPIRDFFQKLWEPIERVINAVGAFGQAGSIKLGGEVPIASIQSRQGGPQGPSNIQQGGVAGTLNIHIDSEGRARVREISKPADAPFELAVYTGMTMSGL